MKIGIHPLFFAVGLASAFFGGLPEFVIFTLTALLHECGHIFCARSMGFECRGIKLTPYGASAECRLQGIRPSDEVKLALAGPLVNACICVALAGLWWFVPITYAYTDTVMQANAVMLAINVLPAYPLDGGRVARCTLEHFFGERAANIVVRALSPVCACAFVALYIFGGVGVSALMFAVFLVLSAFEKPMPAPRINFCTPAALSRGAEIRYILADGRMTYRRAIKFLDEKRYVVFVCGEKKLTQDELYEGFMSHSLYDSIFCKEGEVEESSVVAEAEGCAEKTDGAIVAVGKKSFTDLPCDGKFAEG